MFEVGLDFQEELGEVFGYLLADRTLEGAHVRLGPAAGRIP